MNYILSFTAITLISIDISCLSSQSISKTDYSGRIHVQLQLEASGSSPSQIPKGFAPTNNMHKGHDGELLWDVQETDQAHSFASTPPFVYSSVNKDRIYITLRMKIYRLEMMTPSRRWMSKWSWIILNQVRATPSFPLLKTCTQHARTSKGWVKNQGRLVCPIFACSCRSCYLLTMGTPVRPFLLRASIIVVVFPPNEDHMGKYLMRQRKSRNRFKYLRPVAYTYLMCLYLSICSQNEYATNATPPE